MVYGQVSFPKIVTTRGIFFLLFIAGRLGDARMGCVASEGGAPFVARRAVNLHGC
ncbi:MAG: hypothetical protein ACYC24_04435 [Desulfobacteria bacterium]